jgi:hypothetical protein
MMAIIRPMSWKVPSIEEEDPLPNVSEGARPRDSNILH